MIKLENVKKVYKYGDEEKIALDNINLEIAQGELVAIMGPSGSGKTTLLNMIGCMDSITDGTYLFEEKNISNMKGYKLDKFRGENIAFVFQQFALMKDYTVYENIELPLKIKHKRKSERKSIVNELIKKMNIEDIAKKKVTKISGGQQQRCAIARAVAVNGKVILADEPTGALDQSTGNDIINVFKKLNDENHTIIIVTHDINVANKCKRVITIEDGRICSDKSNYDD